MPTTALAGDRSRRGRNPGDITGRRYAEQQRAEAARKKDESVDWYAVGFAAGFDFGWDAGVQAVVKQLQADGVIDADEPGEEPQDAVSQ